MTSMRSVLAHMQRRVTMAQRVCPRSARLLEDVRNALNAGYHDCTLTEKTELELLGYAMALESCVDKLEEIDADSEQHVRERMDSIVPPSQEELEKRRAYFATTTPTVADAIEDCDYCHEPIYGKALGSGGFHEDGLKFHGDTCRDNYMERAEERSLSRG
jgi:hypothetical protein